MTTIYRTKDGDTVDYICWRFYGRENSGQVEAVLSANPGLAARGPELPAGVEIVMPIITPRPITIRKIFG